VSSITTKIQEIEESDAKFENIQTVLEIEMIEKDQEQTEDSILYLELEKQRFKVKLPRILEGALQRKVSQQLAKEEADRINSILDLVFSVAKIGTSIASGEILGAVTTVIDETRTIINAAQELASASSNLGCPTPKIFNQFLSIADNETLFGHFETFEVKVFENQRKKNEFRRMTHCILAQNIDYQKEPSVEALKAEQLVNEYFDIDEKIFSLTEKKVKNSKNLKILNLKRNQVVNTSSDDDSLKNLMDYHDVQFRLFYFLASYVSHLEYKYLNTFGLNRELKDVLGSPFQVKINKEQNIKLKTILEKLVEWDVQQKNDFRIHKALGVHEQRRRIHIKFEDENILKQLIEFKNVTLPMPLKRDDLAGISEIIGDYFPSHSNIRLKSIFCRLQLSNLAPSNMQDVTEIWTTITQSPVTNISREDGNEEMFWTESPLTVSKRFTVGHKSKLIQTTTMLNCNRSALWFLLRVQNI
jgi:hypothetical protein